MKNMSKLIAAVGRAVDDFFKQPSVEISRTDISKPWKSRMCPASSRSEPRKTGVVVDVSGSMAAGDYPPTRLDGGIHAGIAYSDARATLCPDDQIAVISFSSTAEVVLPLTPVIDRKTVVRAFGRLTADGGTDLAEGLRAAAKLFENEPQSTRRRHVILLTDGQGGEPLEMAAKLKDELDVVIDVVGIGGSPSAVNEALLRQVATKDADGCHYRFIKDPETLSEHYTQLAKGLLWRGGK